MLRILIAICLSIISTYAWNFSTPNNVFIASDTTCLNDNLYLSVKVVKKEQEQLNISPVHRVQTEHETATFGMGCFWGAESLFGAKPGVLRTTVGYAGGISDGPSYRKLDDHTEVVQIDFDPYVTSYKELLQLFWNNHEYGLTTPIKRQYRSLILYHNAEQERIAQDSKVEEQNKRIYENITTAIEKMTQFYPAENYHQKYRLQRHSNLLTTLGINIERDDLLQTSYVASKLNGYLSGIGNLTDFLSEIDSMGLTPKQKEYCIYYAEKNQGHGLYC